MNFITTTLPYANSKPHVGHALEFVQADFWKRYLSNTFLNIGLDEHGKKIYDAALEHGVDTQEFVDNLTLVWEEFCEKFDIRYDNFYRTSDENHKVRVHEVWNQLKNDIYLKNYSGLYCKNCEEFKTSKQIVDNKCSDHPNTVLEEINEENFFFKLTKYSDLNENIVYPINKRLELKNNILNGQDISVSRENVEWGIDVPGSEQTIYVWFEALTNYIFANNDWDNNTNVQLCGPDNLRFQGHLFQSILKALGLKQTDTLLVHGTILDNEGNKMSKSVGNTVDPIEQLDKYGLIPVKYYLLRGINTFRNSNWDEEALVNTYNSDLANNYGNLISRVLHLIKIKEYSDLYEEDEYKENIVSRGDYLKEELESSWDIQEYLIGLSSILKDSNQYLNDEEPWKNDKPQVLYNLLFTIKYITELYKPILGEDKVEEILTAINNREKQVFFKKI